MEKRMKEKVLEAYSVLEDAAPDGTTDLLDVIEYWQDNGDDFLTRGDYCYLEGAADMADVTVS